MKMHADEVEIDERLVGGLIAEQFPVWAGLPVKAVESDGTSNAIYRLGDELCVRLPRIPSTAKHVDKEYEWVPKLGPLLPVATPTPLAKGRPGGGYPWQWTVCEWLVGDNPVFDQLDDPEQLARDLVVFVTTLHGVELAGGPLSKRGVPLATQDMDVRAALRALEGEIDTEVAAELWDAALEPPAWKGGPVWIHGDLMPGNVLVSEGRLSAVIDFGCLGVGDPASDMIPAWNLLPTSAREIFRRGVGVDDATWARGRGWALSMALLQLPYYEHTNPAMAANARHTIKQVLAEQSDRDDN